MRFTIILLAFGVIVYEAACRPSQAADNESEEETEYDGKEDEGADNYLNEKPADKDSQVMDHLDTYNSRGQEDSNNRRPHVSLKHSSAKNNEYENLLEDKPEYIKNEKSNQGDEQEISLSGRSQSHPNLGNEENEEDEDRIEQPVPDSRFNSYKRHDENNNGAKYEDVTLSSDDGTMLEGDRRLTKDNGEYNNEAVEAPEEPLYKHITYFKKVQRDFSKNRKPVNILNLNRNRRQATKDHEEVINDKKYKIENNNEDNESAIKRNIKKLSREELEDLLNSLSDDKKALLKKIMDNKVINDSINKREITKKAGAVEENNYLENGQPDVNKVESGSSIDSISSISQSETTDTTRQSVGSEATKSKDLDTENASSKTDGKEELTDENLSENQQSLRENSDFIVEPKYDTGKEILKIENKRETNLGDLTQKQAEGNHEPSIYGHYDSLDEMDCAKDDNWSKLMKDESELHKSYSNIEKRGIGDYVNSAEVKSLEDSFPNYNEINSKYPNSHLAPLIRVKRTNSNVIKREAGHCANMKVPYFPGAVSDETDDNEKDEFDDGGILEKSYNYERVGKDSNRINDFAIHNDLQPSYANKNNFETRLKKYSKFKSGSDSANIGSDTDNILTNVEGVDDNLMYNNYINTARKKRLTNDPNINKEMETMENNLLPDAPLTLVEDNIADVVSKNKLSRYQENVAIGSIPRNSDEELARFKRIRRLNQTPSSQDNLENTDKL